MTVEPIVIDAELVPDGERQPAQQRPTKAERQHIIGRRIAVAVEQFPKARAKAGKVALKAGKAVVTEAPRRGARVAYTAGQGVRSWTWRAQSALTWRVYRDAIRACEAAQDREALALWTEKLTKAKDDRQARLLMLPKQVAALAAVAGVLFIVAWMVVFLGGATVWLFPGGITWDAWWAGAAATLDAIGSAIQVAVTIGLWAAVPLLAWSAWNEGNRAGRKPRWLSTANERAQLDSLIDERMISQALAHLGIQALNVYFKNGGQITYIVPPRVDGDGTFAQVNLPPGVTAEMIADKRPILAGNLKRASLETWATKADEEGILDLWVADKGKLTAGAGPWPLIDEGEVDVFDGVPFGRSQRGDVVMAPIFESNYLIGGRPGQGKSAAMRTLLLGCALDPVVEMWIFVFGESPDFEPFRPRLTRYGMGFDEDVFERAIEALRDALREMERRGKQLGSLPGTPPKTSRKLASKPALGLHPLVIAFDEVHELFLHPKYGKEAEDLMVRLIKRGRKYGIVLIDATQSPTKDSIPREVTRNVSAGIAFSVADHVANDGLLGSGKYKAGIRATELRPKTDRGTCVTVGLTDNAFELVRGFYVPFEDGRDAVTPVITRAMQGITELRRTGAEQLEAAQQLDLLADVHDAMRGEVRVRTDALLARLAEGDPSGAYEQWGAPKLAAELAAVGVEVGKVRGNSVVRLDDVERALSQPSEDTN